MIGTLIVVAALAFALAFAIAWWLRPGLRRAIEAPKHDFAARVRHYDGGHRALPLTKEQ
jgi:hypothetical protein